MGRTRRAVGTGYLRFAQAELGLFRTAFSVPPDRQDTASPARSDDGGMRPYRLLAAALDGLVDAGVLHRRAAYSCQEVQATARRARAGAFRILTCHPRRACRGAGTARRPAPPPFASGRPGARRERAAGRSPPR
jgi:hypothetical protein